jgi:hypothetical protein
VTETFIRKRHFLRGIQPNEVRHHKFRLTDTDANALKVPGQKMAEINSVFFHTHTHTHTHIHTSPVRVRIYVLL